MHFSRQRLAVWFLLGGLAVASAETRVGLIQRVDEGEAGEVFAEMEVRHGPAVESSRWRVGPELEALARSSHRVRWREETYGGEAWLSQLWPLQRLSADLLAEPEFWVEAKEPGHPSSATLGITATGALLRLDGGDFERGLLLVPYLPTGAADQIPAAVAQAAELRAFLQPTVHRGLPLVLWSLDPGADVLAYCLAWEQNAFGKARNLVWVSGLEELQDLRRQRLGVALAQVDGQVPLYVPTLLVLGADGSEWWRYEGRDWPHVRLERALDGLEAKAGKPEGGRFTDW